MENIKINEVEVKPSGLVIVKFTNEQNNMAEATLNTKWQGKEVQFLQGLIGGCAFVTIEQKGQYTNITAVDMNSGVAGDAHNPTLKNTQVDKAIETVVDKNKSIIAQCLTKCMYNVKSPSEPQEVLDAYNFFLKEL